MSNGIACPMRSEHREDDRHLRAHLCSGECSGKAEDNLVDIGGAA